MMRKIVIILLGAFAFLACNKEQIEPSISVDKQAIEIPASGGKQTVKVTTNQEEWSYSLDPETASSWVELSKSAAGLSISVAKNKETIERTCTVRLTASMASASVTLTQQAGEFVPYIEFSTGGTLKLKADGELARVDVLTNLPSWEADYSELDWLEISTDQSSLTINAAENKLESDRKALVVVYAPNKENFKVKGYLEITQLESAVEYSLENLSAGGTSNCYIIKHKGPYEFDATVRGNGQTVDGLPVPTALNPKGARLVWQSEKKMILSVALDGGKVKFEAGKVAGNALIAATDAAGNIIWSWHIWRPEDQIRELAVKGGDVAMNLNLGAVTDDYSRIGSYGLLYQWGRKDPFPGSPIMSEGSIATVNVNVYDIDGNLVKIKSGDRYDPKLAQNNIEFSIANPTTCISNDYQYKTSRDWLVPSQSNTSLWGNPQGSVRKEGVYLNKGSKTYYDPCPAGWTVANMQTYQHFTQSGSFTWAAGESEGVLTWSDLGGEAEVAIVDLNNDGRQNLLDYKNGWVLYLDKESGSSSYFPAATRYDGQYAMLMGSMVGLWGNYWTNAPSLNSDGSDAYMGQALSFSIKDYSGNYSVSISPISSGSRADAYSVRCVKEL